MMEPWQITGEKVQAAIRRIVEVSHSVSIILFGSYVRGQVGPHSPHFLLHQNERRSLQSAARPTKNRLDNSFGMHL